MKRKGGGKEEERKRTGGKERKAERKKKKEKRTKKRKRNDKRGKKRKGEEAAPLIPEEERKGGKGLSVCGLGRGGIAFGEGPTATRCFVHCRVHTYTIRYHYHPFNGCYISP